MQFKIFALAGMAGMAASQSLVSVLNSTAELSNLTTILSSQQSLVSTLSTLTNITVLAPDNNAISNFLQRLNASGVTPTQDQIQAILSYHVLNGTYANFSAMPMFVRTALMNQQFSQVTGGQRVEILNTTAYSGLKSNSSINATALNFTGGVAHIINSVLTLPQNVSSTLTAFNLTSAYGALSNASLLTAVSGIRDATIFVPNNAAFQAIGSALPNLTTQQLSAILRYHVINGTVAYSSMLSNMSVQSLGGSNLTITVFNSSSVYVNNARVVIPDVLVANGVVHVIDEVLNPMNATANSGGSSAGAPAFSGASSATDVPFTSGVPTPTSSINTGSIAATATGSSSSGGAWMPRATGALGAAALGGLALLL